MKLYTVCVSYVHLSLCLYVLNWGLRFSPHHHSISQFAFTHSDCNGIMIFTFSWNTENFFFFAPAQPRLPSNYSLFWCESGNSPVMVRRSVETAARTQLHKKMNEKPWKNWIQLRKRQHISRIHCTLVYMISFSVARWNNRMRNAGSRERVQRNVNYNQLAVAKSIISSA